MSNKFTRKQVHRGGELNAPRPQHMPGRVQSETVALGTPFQIQGDAAMRAEVQASLEFLAQQHLLEAEEKANKVITKARIEAANILTKANAQSKELLQQVQDQVDSIRDAAHEEGFKAGFQEGYADATEQVEQETTNLLKEAHTLLEGAYQAEMLVLKQFEKQAAALIQHLVRRIVLRDMTDSPDVLMAMIQQAIDNLYLSGKVQVVVSDQVIQDLRSYTTRMRDSVDSLHRFEFIADPNLDLQQVYIIGQEGCFDLSPETQLQQHMAVLADHLTLPRPEAVPEPGTQDTAPVKSEQAPDLDSKAVDLLETEAPLEPEVPNDGMPEPVVEEPHAEPEAADNSPLLAADELAQAPILPPVSDADAGAEVEELATPPAKAVPYEFPSFDDLVQSPPSDATDESKNPPGAPGA